MPRPRLFLIDSFGYIFRAFHARARSGAPPMRTSGGTPTEAVFIFNNMLKKLRVTHQPELIAAVFESEGETLREQEFAAYKANRQPAPPELLEQIPLVRELLHAMRIPILEYGGFEADDVIGTLSRKAVAAGFEVVIVSSDKDLLQLVGEHVFMLNPAKDDEWYDTAKVVEFMGVRPEQVADLLALKGDAVDNIPGAPGIGDKGARDLIQRFGSVEAALDRAAEVERRTYRESLQNHRAQIEMSKRLATIAVDVPIEFEVEAVQAREPDPEALRRVYTELEFFSQLKELKSAEPPAEWRFGQIHSGAELSEWLASSDGTISVCAGGGEGLLAGSRIAFGRAGTAATEAVSMDASIARAAVEDAERSKAVIDAKALELDLSAQNIALAGVRHDVMLYEFALTADPGSCTLAVMGAKYLDRKLGPSIEESAAAVAELAARLSPAVDARGFRRLYEEIDLPLMPVLARMERRGVRIEPEALRSLSSRMEAEAARLSVEIYREAGQSSFNINSPQQLGKVLFDDLAIPHPFARGRTKQYSTAADVLEALAPDYPIARLVLEFRQVTKLKNTYVDTLPELIRPATGRLHTTFNPAGSATGRLSSSNPNLQNIPIRTELGREIRAAFVPEPGWKLVVADYSQIELRLLAHFSRDPVLVEAFRSGEDIHTRTASEVFGVMPLMVTPEMRRDAKAVNFGIVYGLSGFGLAQQLGIPRPQAEKYIKAYFDRYAGVKRFITETIAQVRETGVTKTLFGRERPIPDINSRNPSARGFAERTAVNTPLQGTAADLIKAAMIRIDRLLGDRGWKARMLLQVHDELVLEAPEEEVEPLCEAVRREMEGAAALSVPLLVETGSGDNWRDAK